TIELHLCFSSSGDVRCLYILHSIDAILRFLHQLEKFRAEKVEHERLWPEEDVTATDDSVLAGHMRSVMNSARRVAKTTVTVLIPGESGTGKDIVARAIHEHSDNAQKPFIPFNCTAVPRDLLESHLFGHRRGAFTGADRDYPGLIRTAREGT